MPLPTWPATVTLEFKEDGYREAPARNVDSFQVDHGPALENRATSVPGTVITGVIRCESESEYQDLLEFYQDDLTDGILHFTRAHPRTGAAAQEFKFESFELSRVIVDFHEVSVSMRYFPPVP